MEQKDYMMRQIEQLASVLKMIIADFLDLNNPVPIDTKLIKVSESLIEELDIDLEHLLKLSKQDTLVYFKEKSFHHSHIDLLSDLFTEIARFQMNLDELRAQKQLEKAAELLDIANEISHTITFSRITKRAKIDAKIRKGFPK